MDLSSSHKGNNNMKSLVAPSPGHPAAYSSFYYILQLVGGVSFLSDHILEFFRCLVELRRFLDAFWVVL